MENGWFALRGGTLEAYEEALQFVVHIHDLAVDLAMQSRDELTDRLWRTSNSLLLHVAEAARDKASYDVAVRRALECRVTLDVMRAIHRIDEVTHQAARKHLSEVLHKLERS